MNRVIAVPTDSQPTRAYWTRSRGDSERAFRAARRHSRLVRVLRVVVPAAALLVAVLVIIITYFNPLRMLASLPVNIGSLVVSGSKITMERPHLAGFTRDARAYELSAAAAAQDLTKPNIIELRKIHAKVQMEDKSTMQMSAANGTYDSKTDILKLDHDIQLSSSNGYRGHLSEATIDIRKGNVLSKQPVALTMLQGTLDANRLEIMNSGALIRFDGGVRMTMMLKNDDGKTDATKTGVATGRPTPKTGAR